MGPKQPGRQVSLVAGIRGLAKTGTKIPVCFCDLVFGVQTQSNLEIIATVGRQSKGSDRQRPQELSVCFGWTRPLEQGPRLCGADQDWKWARFCTCRRQVLGSTCGMVVRLEMT